MTHLYIPPTGRTPLGSFNSNGILELSGISMPDNAFDFYSDILNWLRDYSNNPKTETFLTVKLRYLNSSSSGMMFKLFMLLNELQNAGLTKVTCSWYFEEDDSSMQDFVEVIREYAPEVKISEYEIPSVFVISA